METILILVATSIGGLILYAIQSALVKALGKTLNQKFVSLGTLKGKTYDEIVAVCGAPSSNSAISGGTVKQWMATGYHIALLFDENNICLGVSHETSV